MRLIKRNIPIFRTVITNDMIDHEINLKVLEFILNSIEKVKPGFLISSICMVPECNKTKF